MNVFYDLEKANNIEGGGNMENFRLVRDCEGLVKKCVSDLVDEYFYEVVELAVHGITEEMLTKKAFEIVRAANNRYVELYDGNYEAWLTSLINKYVGEYIERKFNMFTAA